MMKKWKTNNKIACSTMVLVMLMAGLSGCIGSEDSEETLRIAFSVKDDYASFDENPQKLADYLSDATGLNVELYPITSDSLALEALRFGSADMAFLDGGAGLKHQFLIHLQAVIHQGPAVTFVSLLRPRREDGARKTGNP